MNLRLISLLCTFLPWLPLGAQAGGAAESAFHGNVHLRGSLTNSQAAFTRERRGTVAFLGGSITEMEGYRPMVMALLQKRFPATAFQFINAGVASTCSTTGAFRLATDVFKDGPVDLLFVEFAVNDDQDAMHTRAECIRGMEGLIRHARDLNSKVDVVMTYFVNEGMVKTLQAGQTPLPIAAHEAVAEHYEVPSIDLAREVAGQLATGQITWQQYGGVHPAPFGNAIAARMIAELLEQAWPEPMPPEAAVKPRGLPEPLDPFNYGAGRFIAPGQATVVSGWTLGVPDWKALPGGKRVRFTSIPMLTATEPGAEARLEFTGTAVGAYVVAGPDAGMLEAAIDGGPPSTVDLFHHFSSGLHYPRTVMLGTELSPGKHTLTVRVAKDSKSGGHAARIMQFTAN